MPSFQWERHGVIPTPTDPTSSGRMVSSILVLHEVATSQAGLYTCTASLRGSINTSTTLNVQSMSTHYYIGVNSDHVYLHHPVSTPTPSISHSVLIAGTESNLTCDSISLGAYVDFHVAQNVSWMVNGSAVATNGRKIISNNGQFLYFSPVSVSDSGRYTCQLTLSVPQTPYVSVHGPVQSSDEVITVKSKQPLWKRQKRQIFILLTLGLIPCSSTSSKCHGLIKWTLYCRPELLLQMFS